MPDYFNPYYKWLGIPIDQQPADHYRLLGLERFEDNCDVITHAADQRMMHLRAVQTGEHGLLSQQLLNEIEAVRSCLLHPGQKAAYDNLLLPQQQAISPFPSPPPRNPDPVKSMGPPAWLPAGDADLLHSETNPSLPLELNIDTRDKNHKRNTGNLSNVSDERRADLESLESDVSEPTSGVPDFANIAAAEKNPDPETLDLSFSREEADGEIVRKIPSTTEHLAPPPLPSTTPASPSSTSTIASESSFPMPPPLPGEGALHDSPQNHEDPLPQWHSDNTDGSTVTFPPPGDHPELTDDAVMPDPLGTDEYVGGIPAIETDIFSPSAEGTRSHQGQTAKQANRKKEVRIRLIGHLLAPIIGLLLGWIILHYILTG
jgi:hypothetical protein